MATQTKKTRNTRKVEKNWEKEEIRSLIEEMEIRPDLWDPSRAQYHNRNLKQKLLLEIANKLSVSSQDVSAKFHSLRTQFNRECSKEKKNKKWSINE